MSTDYHVDLRTRLPAEEVRLLLDPIVLKGGPARPWPVDVLVRTGRDLHELDEARALPGFEPTTTARPRVNPAGCAEATSPDAVQLEAAMTPLEAAQDEGAPFAHASDGEAPLVRRDGQILLDALAREGFWNHVDPVIGEPNLSGMRLPFEWRDLPDRPMDIRVGVDAAFPVNERPRGSEAPRRGAPWADMSVKHPHPCSSVGSTPR